LQNELPHPGVQQLERLIRATPELVGEFRLATVLQRVADLAREVLGARYAAIGLLDPGHRSLATFATSGVSDEQRARIGHPPQGHGVLGLVIKEGRVLRLADLNRHPSAAGLPEHHPPMHSFLGVPVLGRDGALGHLYLTEKIGAPEFSEADVQLAMLLASIVATAVQNAKHYEQMTHLLEETQQLHRSRERFFALVNHALRNALAGIFGWAEMLVRKKDPNKVPRGAFEILEGAEQAVSLVNDLLDLHRLDEDRLKPLLRMVDCCQVVRNAVRTVTPLATDKDVAIAMPLQSSTVCFTDAHRVEQIFVNLLTNAIRHTPPGSRIVIEVDTSAATATFTVRDQGPGVPDGYEERIFDIYFTTADRGEGADGRSHGVGLPLSRRLARLMGGELRATPVSQVSGGGGVFLLSLPKTGEMNDSS